MSQVTLSKKGFSLSKKDFQKTFKGVKSFLVEE